MQYSDENMAKEALRIFFSHLRLFKAMFLIGVAAVLVVAFLVPPTYDVGGSLVVDSKRFAPVPEDLNNSQANKQDIPPSPEDVETEASRLHSPQFLRYAALQMRREGLEPKQGFLALEVIAPLKKKLAELLPAAEADGPGEDLLWKQLSSSMDANALPGTNIVAVHYYTKFPEDDLKIADTLMQAYLKFRATPNTAETPASFFLEKKNEYKKRLADLETRKSEMLRNTALAGSASEEIARLSARASQLQVELSVLRENETTTKTWIEYITKTLKNMTSDRKRYVEMPPFPLQMESGDMRDLNVQLYNLIVEYIRASSTFTPEFSGGQTSKDSLLRLQRYILRIADNEINLRKTQLEILERKIEDHNKEIERISSSIELLKRTGPELALIDAESESVRGALAVFTRRVEESNLQSLAGQFQLSNVRIAATASMPEHAMFPRKRIVLPVGLAGSFLLALAAVFIKNAFCRTFASPAQVRAVLGLPVIASIPDADAPKPALSDLWSLRGWFRGRAKSGPKPGKQGRRNG